MALTGNEVIGALQKALDAPTLGSLANELGITGQAIQNWKKRPSVTPRQIAGLVKRAKQASYSRSQHNSVRPVVEFFPIRKVIRNSNGRRFDLFSSRDGRKTEHPYLAGLKAELSSHHGVYIFFDSRGQAIYAGKARKQSLWREMNLAFNRKRNDLQKIRRVKHPLRRIAYKTSEEKSRQIYERTIPLHELAYYFSAYEVDDGMVNVVESMLVRSFANDLLNKRMERFGANGNSVSKSKKK